MAKQKKLKPPSYDLLNLKETDVRILLECLSLYHFKGKNKNIIHHVKYLIECLDNLLCYTEGRILQVNAYESICDECDNTSGGGI